MEDCLELILNMDNGIYINRRYYDHFIKKKIEWNKKCFEVMWLVQNNCSERFFKQDPSLYRGRKFNSYVYYANVIHDAIMCCDKCKKFADNCRCSKYIRCFNIPYRLRDVKITTINGVSFGICK